MVKVSSATHGSTERCSSFSSSICTVSAAGPRQAAICKIRSCVALREKAESRRAGTSDYPALREKVEREKGERRCARK
jgi:hypothetical protein